MVQRLSKRVFYGGRKGASAMRRLRQLGVSVVKGRNKHDVLYVTVEMPYESIVYMVRDSP